MGEWDGDEHGQAAEAEDLSLKEQVGLFVGQQDGEGAGLDDG